LKKKLHNVERTQDRKSRLHVYWEWFFTTAHSENVCGCTKGFLNFTGKSYLVNKTTGNNSPGDNELGDILVNRATRVGSMGDKFVTD